MRSAGCGCEPAISRRRALKAGLAAAAAGAIGKARGAFAASPAQGQNPPVNERGAGAVDIHAHYFPESYLNLFNQEGRKFGAEYHKTDENFTYKTPLGAGTQALKFIDLKLRIADMDQQGVAVQAMSLTSPMVYWGDEDLDHKLATAWNDATSAAHQAYPARLIGFCTLPMLYPDRALDELNRASRLPGIRGVYMGTNINNKDLDDPLFEPIWARVEELGLPVFLHPLQTVGGKRLRPFYLSNLLGNPFDGTVAASHLIFGGVLDRHPKLVICLPHGGGVLPILIGRIDHGWRVRAECKHLSKAPSTYLDRFYYDTIVHSKPIMEFVIKEVGAERIMVGSDYCFDMGYERPVGFLDEIDLTSSELRMIMAGTAARLLKL